MGDSAGYWLLAILAGAALLFFFGFVARTSRRYDDQLQRDLVSLIKEYGRSDFSESAVAIFTISSERALLGSMVLDPKERRQRLDQALAMARSSLSAERFEFVRRVITNSD